MNATPAKKIKALTDRFCHTIEAGTIVKMGDGWLRVTSVSVAKKMVNLRGVFGGSTILKQVPLEMVFEDREAWYKDWSESESYKCM